MIVSGCPGAPEVLMGRHMTPVCLQVLLLSVGQSLVFPTACLTWLRPLAVTISESECLSVFPLDSWFRLYCSLDLSVFLAVNADDECFPYSEF